MIMKIRSISSPAHYASLLSEFYSFFGALEPKIDSYISPVLLPDVDIRRKLKWLELDLQLLNMPVPALVGNHQLPEIHDALQAFGALYVLEGSTLGGQIICHMIAKQLDAGGVKSLNFFSGYGKDTLLMWEKFKEAMNNAVRTEADSDTLINTANETFLKFKDCIDVNERAKKL